VAALLDGGIQQLTALVVSRRLDLSQLRVGRQVLDEIDGAVEDVAQNWWADRGRMVGTSERSLLIIGPAIAHRDRSRGRLRRMM
jgi:hypothetical protein